MNGSPAVLTVPEAAQLLRIGRGAAYEAARTGELPTVRIGRTLRVPRHALAALLGESEPSVPDLPAPAGGGQNGAAAVT